MIDGQKEQEFIDEWAQKIAKQIDKRVKDDLERNPSGDLNEVREQALLDQLATVHAGCVRLEKRVKELENKLDMY